MTRQIRYILNTESMVNIIRSGMVYMSRIWSMVLFAVVFVLGGIFRLVFMLRKYTLDIFDAEFIIRGININK